MPIKTPIRLDLKAGLLVLALVSGVFATLLVSLPAAQAPAASSPEAASSKTADFGEANAFASQLMLTSPAAFAKLQSAWIHDASASEQRSLILNGLLTAFKDDGLTLRRAPVSSFDHLVRGFREGLGKLSKNESDWCRGDRVEQFIRLKDTEIIPFLVDEIAGHDEAYAWTLNWGTRYLGAVENARQNPTPHGRRTPRDKALLQNQGMSLGPEHWALALQIAAFSKAEGEDYQTMRSVIEGIDVCQMGLVMTELSDGLPSDVRGRIWAQLLPEIFVGNTGYVLYTVNDYFFLDPA